MSDTKHVTISSEVTHVLKGQLIYFYIFKLGLHNYKSLTVKPYKTDRTVILLIAVMLQKELANYRKKNI